MESPILKGRARSVEIGLMTVLALLASGFIGLFYAIAYRRFRYPDQLELLEGGVLDAVRRVVHHQPVYVAPSSTWVPYIYTPGYYYFSALLCRVMGVTFTPLRIVSILATTGCLVLLFWFVRRSTGSNLCGLLSAGLFAALYSLTNSWFDVARVDMLSLFFLLAGIVAARQGLSVWSAIAFAVAFQTKQSAAGVAILVLAHDFRHPRKLLSGLGTFILLAGASAWWLNHASDGWYRYYTSFLPSHQAWASHKLASFFLHDFIDPLGVTLALIVLAGMLHYANRGGEEQTLEVRIDQSRRNSFLLFTSAGVGITSLAARLHRGGTTNVSLPAFCWVCILFGLAVHALTSMSALAPARSAAVLRLSLLAACVIQFAQLIYSPAPFVPTATQTLAAARLQQEIAGMKGRVFVVHNVVDIGLSGLPESANSMSVWDVLRADKGPAAANLRADLIRTFQEKQYTQVIADRALDEVSPDEAGFVDDIAHAAATAYPVEHRLLTPLESYEYYEAMTTGITRPNFLYSPRP